ncbi:MAG: ABC transporter substrate-binding protein [Rhodospirillales bacterium]|nr:ABC transporter substrate-binding protein [Rhodospirillales bacterium]
MRKSLVAVALCGALVAFNASAQELKVGLGAPPTSMDPLYHNLDPNNQVARHIFDTLIDQDEKQRLRPALATSWKLVDESTWEFKLREGVKFHDGTPFTAEDVVFSIQRAEKVPNSPSAFTIYTKAAKEVVAVDPTTVRIKTDGPYPLLPNDLSNIRIQSKKAAEGKSTEDFNKGTATIGTGPFKFVEWVPGDRLVLERNDNYWGEKAEWARVIFRPITSSGTRVAALLSGDVDFIDNVPPADIKRLKSDPNVAIWQSVSNRIIYLHIDSDRDKSPMVTDKQGQPLDKNPLKDVRVRKAISKAINRQGIVERVLDGVGIPAGQLLPEGFFGVSPNLHVEKYDPEGAKKLLAEAGWPNGFGLTLHGPNNRYINDKDIVQAIAPMLSRIGIDTKVETMPANIFFSRGSKLEFSLMLVGWGSGTGEASSPLKSLLATFDKTKGWGPSNRGRYSNPKLDAALDEALRTVDDAKREKLLQQATEIGINELGIIPLHYEVSTWASKKGYVYKANTNQHTLAHWLRKG